MNNKSITERLNNVKDKGPDKWLSRDLFEEPYRQNKDSSGKPAPIQNTSNMQDRVAALKAKQAQQNNQTQANLQVPQSRATITSQVPQPETPERELPDHIEDQEVTPAMSRGRVEHSGTNNPRLQELYDMSDDFHAKESKDYFIKEGEKLSEEKFDDYVSYFTDEANKGNFSIDELADRSILDVTKDENLSGIKKILIPLQQELEAVGRNNERFSGELYEARDSARWNEVNDDEARAAWNRISRKPNGSILKKVQKQFAESGWGLRAKEYIQMYKDKYGDDWEKMYDERGYKMFKTYLQQGGRDGWVGDKDTAAMPMGMFQADHIVDAEEANKEFWQNYATENGLDPEDWYYIADDPEHNMILTRSAINEQTKKGNTIGNFHQNLTDYLGDGSEEHFAEHNKNAKRNNAKALTRKLRDEQHHGPLLDKVTEMVRNGEITPDVYEEIVNRYQEGRQEILGSDEKTGDFSDEYEYLGNGAMDMNSGTDIFRALGDAFSRVGGGSNFGIYADEAIRKQKKKQKMGWYGFGLSTSPSNAKRTDEKGEYTQYSLNHPALDYYKDVMYQLSAQGDYDLANNYHQVANIMGNALTAGGGMGSRDWVETISNLAKHAKDKVTDFRENFDIDQESNAHAKELARRIGTNHLPKHVRLGEDNIVPRRDTEGVDALFGPGYQANKAGSVSDLVTELAESTSFKDILSNQMIMGGNLAEVFIAASTYAIIEGKLDLKGTLDAFF